MLTHIISDICQSDPCDHGGTCIKTDNGYVCICQGGRAGSTCQIEDNGLYACQYIDL